MTRHRYFFEALRRRNIIWESILDFFLSLTSYPRLVLEVFIRKNFGRRYFSLATCITATIVLIFLPILQHRVSGLLARYSSYGYNQEPLDFWLQYTTWYVFTAGFIYCSFHRWKEVRQNNARDRFDRITLYSGDIDLRFFGVKLFGQVPTVRIVTTIYEPALFFIAGLILTLLGQKVGILLQWCSLFYCLGYIGAYKKGDDTMDDISDNKKFCQQKSAYVNEEINNKHGLRYYMTRPSKREEREELFEEFLDRGNVETTYVS